jgi:capsular polysaccharide transport system permease protein
MMRDNTPVMNRSKKRHSISIQWAAIHALFMREILTRFGHYRLGYLWVVLEPAMHVGFMLILFGAVIKHTIPGMSYSIFLIGGILPWFLFSNSAGRALGAVAGNKGLFHYRIIKPIDAIAARVALEAVIYFLTFVFFALILALLGDYIDLNHIPILLLCWVGVVIYSFAISLIMMVVGSYSGDIEKVVGAVLRIMYFASGILYSVHAIPEKYQPYILWNPIVHVIEVMRFSLSPQYPIGHVSLLYFFVCTFILLGFGLLVYRARERAMLTSS